MSNDADVSKNEAYGVFRAKLDWLFWQHARDEYECMEKAGTITAEVDRRANAAWKRLVRMRESGIDYVTAMEMLALDLYPTAGEVDDMDYDFKYGL